MNEVRAWPFARTLLATAMLSTSLLGLGLAGCAGDTNSTTTSSPGFKAVEHPTGTVTGTIVDSNGNPIAGATVSIPDGAVASAAKAVAKVSVTTDASGQFSIPKVVATNVANSTGSFTGHNPIVLTITPPDGYLGANVTVNPQAQVVGDTPPVGSQTNPQIVFISGFTADTGLIKLPALTTTVTGTLQDGTTGAPIANQAVDLDFRGPAFDNGTPGVAIQFAQNLLTVNTGADGSFSIANVADDSCFNMASPSYVLAMPTYPATSGCGGFGTSNGGIIVSTQNESANTVALGDVGATSAITGDTTPPYVTKVAEVINQQASPGQLASGSDGTTGLNISFSEPVTVVASPTVTVTETAPGGSSSFVVPSTAAYSGGVLTVTTGSALQPGALVKVDILAQDVKDGAGNALTGNGPGGGVNPPEVAYDTNSGDYDELVLKVFQPPVTGLSAVTNLAQINTPFNADSSSQACAQSQALYASSNAFLDTSPDDLVGAFFGGGPTCAIGELNSDSTRGFFGGSTVSHLIALENALLGSSPVPIFQLAHLSFTTSGAVDYVVVVKDKSGNPVALGTNDVLPLTVSGTSTASVSGTVTLDPPYSDSTTPGVVIKPSAAAANGGTVDFLLSNVLPSDTVYIVPRGTGGVLSSDVASAASLVLQDNGRPTTGVQVLMAVIQASVSGGTTGSGGGPIVSTATAGGQVIYPVTPLAYDRNVSATGTFGPMSLYSGGPEDLMGADEPGGLSNPAISGFLPLTSPANSIYDATGWAAFDPTNDLGISVTEPLSTTATQPAPNCAGCTAMLSFLQVLNNVFSPADGSNDNDLYVMKVDNLNALQADGRANKVIDLSGITDEGNRVAGPATHADVQLRDFTPPFMTAAYRTDDGASLVFKFNEAVDPTAVLTGPGNVVQFVGCGFFVNMNTAFDTTTNSGAQAATLTSDGKVITIPMTNTALAGFPGSACFGGPSYAEPAIGAATPVAHGEIAWTVPDTADNSDIGFGDAVGANDWVYWQTAPGLASTLGVPIPVFAAADLLGAFTVKAGQNPPVCANFTNGSNNFSCAVMVNQPIYFGTGATPNFAGFADLSAGGYLTQTALNHACIIFDWTDSTGHPRAVHEPTSCNPLDASGALVTASGTGVHAGEFTPNDVAKIQGLVANFNGGAQTVNTGDKFTLDIFGGCGGGLPGNACSISSAPYSASGFSVTGYATSGLATQGVVVPDDGVNPQNAFELLPAVAP